MEIRIVLRGGLAGFVAGVLGFVFAFIFVEPLIDKAIDYESRRDHILAQLNRAAGRPIAADGSEVFSRHFQSTVGLASGIVAFATAMGALSAVAYVTLHGRFRIRAMHLVWLICGLGFLGVYLLPFAKYPANPPAVGHSFTVTTREHLYLLMVAFSSLLLGLAVLATRWLTPRLGLAAAVVASAVAFLTVYGTLIGLAPSLGELGANEARADEFGFARAATETPQPIHNIMSRTLLVDGRSIRPGQLVYPGFDADVLWKFRWYSIVEQLLIWTVIALVSGWLLERLLSRGRSRRQPAGAASLAAAVS